MNYAIKLLDHHLKYKQTELKLLETRTRCGLISTDRKKRLKQEIADLLLAISRLDG